MAELLEDAPQYDLQAQYDRFNKLLFDGSLPRIPLTWKKLKNVGGKALAGIELDPHAARPNPMMVRLGRVDKYANYRVKSGSLRIEISTLYKRSARALDQILVHEMIHIWCLVNGFLGEAHGDRFQRMVRKCSDILGYEIPLKDEVEGLEFSAPIAIKPVGVILVEGRTRTMYCIVVAAALEANLDYLKERLDYRARISRQHVSFYLIADQMWAEESMRVKVQRSVKNLSYYPDPPATLLTDLKQNGRLLAELTP